jgi:hypothetical protein
VDKLIKKLNSWNEKKRLKAKRTLSKVAGNILPYFVKKFKSAEWKFFQYDELKRFYDIINQKVAQVGIGCVDEEGNILWYALLKGENTKGTILIGINERVINVHSIIDNKFRDIKQWQVKDIFCKKAENNKLDYLIEIANVRKNISHLVSQEWSYRNIREYKKIREPERYGFIARKVNNKEVAVIDGKESAEYDYIDGLTFSFDGRRYGFKARSGNSWVAVIDGREIGKYDYLFRPVFSADGKRFGIIVKNREKWFH